MLIIYGGERMKRSREFRIEMNSKEKRRKAELSSAEIYKNRFKNKDRKVKNPEELYQ